MKRISSWVFKLKSIFLQGVNEMPSLVILPFILITSLLFLIIPIALGIYVYKDAESRGMSGLLWTLIVVLAPSFIGLIIYLLIRENQSGYECGNCGAAVKATQDFCPSCGASLRSRYDHDDMGYGEAREGRVQRQSGPRRIGPLIIAAGIIVLGLILLMLFIGMIMTGSTIEQDSFMWQGLNLLNKA